MFEKLLKKQIYFFSGEMFASWDPLFPRGKAEQSEIKSISLIPVGVQPEQALL